jgi:adenylate cyclase, class 2
MQFINVEIKAKTIKANEIRFLLLQYHAKFIGTDNQRDVYFNVPDGRLKLRSGNIENNLIFYRRANTSGPKTAECHVTPVADVDTMYQLLKTMYPIKVEVNKQREIYLIENMKFHLDHLNELGDFVEIEASNKLHPQKKYDELLAQCNNFIKLFGITAEEMVHVSYSDMLMNKY